MKQAPERGVCSLCLWASLVLVSSSASVLAAYSPPPDLTEPGAIATLKTNANASPVYGYSYNLGPTGLRGWIYIDRGNNAGELGTMTAQPPWQILVYKVGSSTPASGIMAVDDVILGASAGATNLPVPLFTSDSRKSLGWAITAAEAGDGKLNLKRWRAGVTNDVTLQLRVLGVYSDTAPYNCPKSALILSNATTIIAGKSFNAGTPGDEVLGLALMAVNSSASKVQTYARKIAPSNLSLNPNNCDTWTWGYHTVFLAEYYLKTGDANVLSGLNKYTIALAKAQGLYGTFGHGGAEKHADGSLHGSIPWYGPVNSAGLIANMGIVLGRKAIVAGGLAVDAEIDPAIDRAAKFFAYYVDKGSIPYGEHEPWYSHGSNGKNCMAALFFGLLGNRPVETEYYTRMSVAGYNAREYGHTGQGFSYVWSGPACNVGGTNAMASHLAQVRWHLDLSRRHDGSFCYDGDEQYGCSQVSDYWTTGGNNSYYDVDPTATYVLTYAAPLRQLYITGKSANTNAWLSSGTVTNAIWAGMFDLVRSTYDTNQLVSAMTEYDPLVRSSAAQTLGARTNFSTAQLISMANSSNVWLRQSACEALGVKKDTSALTMLGQRLTDTNIWVRSKASKAMQKFGSAASPQLTTMLTAFITNATDPHVIVWDDPMQIANGYLADELFNTLGASTINASTNLLYPALRAGLQQPDGMALDYLNHFVANRLTLAHVQAVASNLVQAVAVRSPADRMFSDGIRYSGALTLGKYLIEEGIPLSLMIKEQAWHSDDWEPFQNLINNYRGAAKEALPTLYKWRDHLPQFAADDSIGACCPGRLANISNYIYQAIAVIEGDTNPPPLRTFKSLNQIVASPPVIALPTTNSSLRVAETDLDGGVPAFAWSKVSGPGNVTFTPNRTTGSSNTMARFSGLGTYDLQVSAYDTSILNSNIWITFSAGYYDFQTYTNIIGAVSTNVTVTVVTASSNASLVNLVPSAGSLSPAFASNIFSYAASVGFGTTTLTVKPTAGDAAASITVNGTTVFSGNPSSPINLSVGTNVITTVVVSSDTTTTNTYSLTVTRPAVASTNACLANLVPSAGSLTPAFASNTFNYTASVPYATASLTVTPTAADSFAMIITVNGTPVASGSPSGAISLSVGTNVITTAVTADDGVTTKTYTLTVTRAPDPNLLFADTFDRPDGTNLNASTAGKSGTLGTLNYAVKSGGSGGFGIESNRLKGGDNGAGAGWAIAYLSDHNFTDAVIARGGGMSISIDLLQYATAGSGRIMGIGVGQSLAELTGAATRNGTSDLLVAYRYTTQVLEIYKNGVLDSSPSIAGYAVPQTLRIDYAFSDFKAGSTVSYNAYLGNNLITSGSFTWSGTNENYISIHSNLSSQQARMDNFEIKAFAPPPSDYDNWSKNYPDADLSDPNADLDGDGLSNDYERIWGLNPTNALSKNLFTSLSGLATGSFSYTRRAVALSGLSYAVWTSTNLTTWTQDTGASQMPGTPDAMGVQSVTVNLSPSLLTGQRLFVRLRANSN